MFFNKEFISQSIHDECFRRNVSEGQGSSNQGSLNRPAALETTVYPHDPFTEATVKELEALGFTRAQVIAELRRFSGDKTQATAALFAKSLKFWISKIIARDSNMEIVS